MMPGTMQQVQHDNVINIRKGLSVIEVGDVSGLAVGNVSAKLDEYRK